MAALAAESASDGVRSDPVAARRVSEGSRSANHWILPLLVVLALGLRWLSWHHTAVIFNDGPRFLRQAEHLLAGRWDLAFAEAYHPLYAMATAAFASLGAVGLGGVLLENAAAAVSIAAGSAAVACLYLFLRDAFGAPYDWLGALLFATHRRAIEYSADVQSEGLFFFAFVAAIALTWRALDRRSVAYAFGAGLIAAVAYWTRPEGLLVGLSAGLVAPWWAWRRAWGARRWLRWSAALGVGMGVGVVGYALALHATIGEWDLTQKKPIPIVERSASSARVPAGGEPVEGASADQAVPAVFTLRPRQGKPLDAALADLWYTTRSAARPLLLGALPVAALILRRPGLRGGWLATLTLAYFALLLWLLLTAGYVSRRHILAPLLPLFGYAGVALVACARAATRRFPSLGRLARPAPLAFAAILTLPFETEPRRIDKLAERHAAEWLAAIPAATPHERVGGVGGRVGYYARRPMVDVRNVEPEALAGLLQANRVRFAVFDDEAAISALEDARSFESIHTFSAAGTEARVFERTREGEE